MSGEATVYVSITGLRVTKPWFEPVFWWHAVRSMIQAKRAAGNLRAEAKTINGVRHTLTVWRSREDMRAFLYTGAHRAAIRGFRRFAEGATFGFETNEAPNWDQAHALWLSRGARY